MPQTVFTQTFTVTLSDQSPDLDHKFDSALVRLVAVNPKLSVSDLVVGERSDELVETDAERTKRERTEQQAKQAAEAATRNRNIKLLELKGWLYGEHLKQQAGLPSEWSQGTWATQTACGTSCCIAGKTVLEAGGEFVELEYSSDWTKETFVVPEPGVEASFSRVRMPDNEVYFVGEKAGELIGLTNEERLALFEGDNTYEMASDIIDAIIAGDDPYAARRLAQVVINDDDDDDDDESGCDCDLCR